MNFNRFLLGIVLVTFSSSVLADPAHVYCDCTIQAGNDPCTCFEPGSSSISTINPAYTGSSNGHFNVEAFSDRYIYINCDNKQTIASSWKISHTGSVTCYNKSVGNPTKIQCQNSGVDSHKVHLDYFKCDAPISSTVEEDDDSDRTLVQVQEDELVQSLIVDGDSVEVQVQVEQEEDRKLGSASQNHCGCDLSKSNPCSCFEPGSSSITVSDPAYTGDTKLQVKSLEYASFYLHCDNNPTALATNIKVSHSGGSDLSCGPKDVGNPTQFQCYNKNPLANHHMELKHYDCQTDFSSGRKLRGSS